jgi:hypothetical protein
MKTAVIVAGVVRELANASSSWKVSGDYYLFADEYEREPQTQKIKKKINLSEIHETSAVNFQYISISKSENNIDWSSFTPPINLYKKLSSAYTHIKNKRYCNVLIIRPDLFIPDSTNDIINNISTTIGSLTIGIDGNINPGDMRTRFRPSLDKDILMYMDLSTFKIIAEFYNFIEENIQFVLENKFDVHTLLGKYILERNINVKDIGCKSVILRNNTAHFFKDGTVTFEKLQKAFDEWWNHNIDPGISLDKLSIYELIERSKANGGILKLRNISK